MNGKIRALIDKLDRLKGTKEWLEGDKKAEKEVNDLRKQIKEETLAEMSPRERIDSRARLSEKEAMEQ